ncbi:MAG: hydantoinase B/oxoprolinase family protein [Rhodospirillales bacterium]|nr:hydantoinase B/oxoprolinase family protein [Rhodospirillales bacterium]MDP6646574.1 hydantoinase B/oxoprolinase family protein [Rhodospirillales bacterium]MDP6840954.1 hydantoinase B/oxoprolinase family protein [Rhodospirillales bacterium]
MNVHPITLEVVRNAFVAYSEEMATALCRSAYNMMIYEVRDFCCGLIDTEGRLISQNSGGLPIFLADLGVAVLDGIERYGLDGFEPGDVVIMNHGEVCGQHLNNIVIYTPCFYEGELIAFAANRAHWVDVGGSRVGFGSYTSTEIYEEGLQLRSLKIYEAGKRNQAIWQILEDNIRFPESSLGDLRAQIAACNIADRRLAELYGRYDAATVSACIDNIWDQSEAEARDVVRQIPDGTYEAESYLDNDGRDLNTPLRVKASVTVKGGDMIIDYTGMHPQVNSPLNSGHSGGLAAARIAFKCLTLPNAPVNEGCFRPLELISPEGTMVNAKPPAAIGLWSVAMPTVVDTILRALAPALPDRIPAAHKGDMGGCSFYGYREDDGKRFLLMNIMGGGWGGKPDGDGESAAMSICQGDVRNAPIEVQEMNYPFLIECHKLRTDSGGAGRSRGGLGVEVRYRCLQPTTANINFDRTHDAPWGLHGGREGAVNQAIIRRTDGTQEIALKATNVKLNTGDSVTFLTGAGGGYGPPEERSKEAIAADIKAGFISEEAAVRDYGVAPAQGTAGEAAE